MKKKLLVGLFTLTAASMLCGFDSAETVDGVLTKMQEATANAESMSMNMGMNFDVALNIGDGTTTSTLGILVAADFDAGVIIDPMAMSMEGTMDLSALGETQTIGMKMYMVTNDANELEVYVYSEDSATGEGVWSYETSSMEGLDMEELMAAAQEADLSLTAADYAEWGLPLELAPEAADVDGAECYVLSTSIDAASLSTMMNKALEMSAEMTGEDIAADEEVAEAMAAFDEIAALLEGLKIDLEFYVDTTTYLPALIHMDMNDSDMTMLNSIAAAYMTTTNEDGTANVPVIDIVINDLSIDYTYTLNDVEAITVPDEAIAAVEAGEALSVEDVEADLEAAM